MVFLDYVLRSTYLYSFFELLSVFVIVRSKKADLMQNAVHSMLTAKSYMLMKDVVELH